MLLPFFPTEVSIFTRFTFATRFPNFHDYIFLSSYGLYLNKQIILENNPQSEENKLGTLLERHCKFMSLVFQGSGFFGLIARNLLCEHKLFGYSFYRLNGTLFMHTSPMYPF